MNRNFSKEEAQRVFSLAAERQQAIQSSKDDQLTLQELEEAGLAAGIDPEFIRAAASDILRPDRATEQRSFFGFPVELRESHVLTIPYSEEHWRKMVDVFISVYEKPGVMRELGTTRRWQSDENDNQMPTQIIAEKDGDGTRITIERKMWPLSLGFGISSAVNLLIGFIFFAVWMSVGSADEMIIPASIMMGIGAMLGLFGSMGTRMASKAELNRFAQVFSHLESMGADNELQNGDPLSQKGVLSPAADAHLQGRIALEENSEITENDTRSSARLKTS